MSVLPEFAEAYHEASIQVKQEVITRAEEGMSVTILASETRHFAGGPYAEKTLRRWLRAWRQRLLRHQERLWERLLHDGLETELPRERISDIRALLAGWNNRLGSKSLFSTVLLLERSHGMAVSLIHPTAVGHSLSG
jgi:hypothetical protein